MPYAYRQTGNIIHKIMEILSHKKYHPEYRPQYNTASNTAPQISSPIAPPIPTPIPPPTTLMTRHLQYTPNANTDATPNTSPTATSGGALQFRHFVCVSRNVERSQISPCFVSETQNCPQKPKRPNVLRTIGWDSSRLAGPQALAVVRKTCFFIF